MTPEGPRVAAPSSCGTEDSVRSYHSPPPCLWHHGMEKRILATEIPPGDAMHHPPPLRPSTKGRKGPLARPECRTSPDPSHPLQAAPGHSEVQKGGRGGGFGLGGTLLLASRLASRRLPPPSFISSGPRAAGPGAQSPRLSALPAVGGSVMGTRWSWEKQRG